jgi:predicted ATP-grasp superfamily ATP-dependent carboligase
MQGLTQRPLLTKRLSGKLCRRETRVFLPEELCLVKIAVMEWIRGGGLAGVDDSEIPPSLVGEGALMMNSLVRLLSSCGCEVVCCLDGRWGMHGLCNSPNVRYIQITADGPVATPPRQWRDIARECDRVMVIAPEIDDVLHGAVNVLRRDGSELVNCQDPLLSICCDKWQCFLQWSAAGILTPPTQLLMELDDRWLRATARELDATFDSRWIVKPRDGAGSEDLMVLQANSADRLIAAFQKAKEPKGDATGLGTGLERYIVQPLIRGAAHSRCVVVDLIGRRHWLPLMTQELAADYRYAGGQPVEGQGCATVEDWRSLLVSVGQALAGEGLCTKTTDGVQQSISARLWPPVLGLTDEWCEAVLDALGGRGGPDGERGWLGLDLVRGVDGRWYAIECNPRCTSSIGPMIDLAGLP